MCKEAAMRPLRRFFDKLELQPETEPTIDHMQSVEIEPVTMLDLKEALTVTKPSYNSQINTRYEKWEDEFGSR